MTSSFDHHKFIRVNPDEEIVISGIAGRFPNSKNLEEFSHNLYNKIDMVDEEESRWKHTMPEVPKRNGKVYNLDRFDSLFFSVHYNQAIAMDPQCRALLEHSYEAILDAGINPKTLRGSRTGVYIGCCFADSEQSMYASMVRDGLGLTGSSRALLSNRISFSLGLQGPSFTIDTACSSSMYALDCGFNSIRNGECDAAIVGGTNLTLHPFLTLQFARLGVLAKDGFCRPFDNGASGYTRSEAIAVVFLQKAADAKRIYANLVYTKTNNDGFKQQGMTYPNCDVQIKLLKEFYADLQMDPSTIEYVEAHSTGTKVGDPEECNTLDEIFCKGRNGRPLPVGSVKSNMGHSEGASGLCSLAKVLIAFENNRIPPNIHFVSGREGIPSLQSGRLQVVVETQELAGPYICVNSFGFGGGNAHVLFKQNPKEKINRGIPTDNLQRLVVWSGRTDEAVGCVLQSISKQPLDAEYVGLLHNISPVSPSANTYRGFGIYQQVGVEENAQCVTQHSQHYSGTKRPIAWIYSGMGSQWCEMGADLMRIPIFAEAIEKCHGILLAKDINLKNIITSKDPTMFDNILNSFVGIASIQIGLTDILKAIGLKPDFIVGHSVGELGCAYADECFTAEEMILSAYSRGMASIESKVIKGSMAAIGLGYKTLKTMIPDGIEIACHNSAESCTISGPADKIAEYVKELVAKKIFAREVNCSSIAYHSSYIAELGPKLLIKLKDVIKRPMQRSSKWISSSVPKERSDTIEAQFSSPHYHTNNLLSSVLFEEAIEDLPKDCLMIEIAPHGLLQAILKAALPDSLSVALTKKNNTENCVFLLNALGRIYENGCDIDLSKLYPPVKFPVSRGTPTISSLIKWDHSYKFHVMDYEVTATKAERSYLVNLSDPDYEFIQGHSIDGRVLFPAAGYLYLVWVSMADQNRKLLQDCDLEFDDVKFHRATVIKKNQNSEFAVVVNNGSGRFEINEALNTIVTGYVKLSTSKLTDLGTDDVNADHLTLGNKDFYKELRLRGYHYSGLFRSIVSARTDGQKGQVKWDSNWVAFLDCLLQLQIVAQDMRTLALPTGLRKLIIKPKEHQKIIDELIDFDKILTMTACKDLNTLRCGGVEMRGLQYNNVGRRRPAGDPVLESYEFFPHFGKEIQTEVDMARFCIQLILENNPIVNVTIVEIDSYDGKEPLIENFGQALADLPLVTGNFNYLSSRALEMEKVNVQDAALSSMQQFTIVVKSNMLKDNCFLESVSDLLSEGGFLVSRESKSENHFHSESLPKNFQIIATINMKEESIILLQHYKSLPTIPTKVVQISMLNYDWLEELKEAIKIGPVMAFSEMEELSGIVGLVNCIRKEPDGLNLRCAFISDPHAPPFDINDQFYKSHLQQGLALNVFKDGLWGSYKHMALTLAKETSPRLEQCYVNSLVMGDLSSLTWLTSPQEQYKSNNEIVRIQYAALNFKDVMLATGKLSVSSFQNSRLDQHCILGLEYSGVTQGNQRVMGMLISGALATAIESDELLTWKCPDQWTLQEAATVPVVYGTVYSAFFMTIRIEKNKSILIHAGSGGVGLAAIRVAFAYGLKVFTTVSTEEKKKFLLNEFPELESANIGCSRDRSFEDLVMRRTNGKGVDYVLNCLAGELLQASIRCLKEEGHFLEIGKFDIANDTKIGLGNFSRELSFHAVLVDRLFNASLEKKLVLKNLLQNDMDRGVIKPLPATAFDACDVEKAFRFLAGGKHIGKVLLRIRDDPASPECLPIAVTPQVHCDSTLVYIIPGGLGGVGLELCDWLVLRGCRKLVLSSVRGIRIPYQAFRIKTWESYGVKVSVNTSDIGTMIGCEKLIRDAMEFGDVGGIFNLAVLLRDGIFENQDVDKFAECMAPKADATKHLDELSRQLCPKLQYFVVFSSVSCGRGNAGQCNYGMANSVMERIIEQRFKLGLPAKAIQWGAVGEVGLVADMQENNLEMVIGGTLQQRISSCLQELDTLLTSNKPIVASMIVAEKRYKSSKGSNILDAIMNIMSIRDSKSLSMETTLSELGMDSLMTVEILQTLEREHEVVITAQELRTMTISELIKCSNNKLSSGDQAKVKNIAQNVPTAMKLLVRSFGDESSSNKTILKLESLTENGIKTLIIPGIEGMAGQAYRTIAQNLNCPVYLLQNIESSYRCLEEIFDAVVNDVLSLFADDETFTIIAYSFGALIGIRIAKALEAQNKSGQLVLIDGSPKFLKAMASAQVTDIQDENMIQAAVLSGLISIGMPEKNDAILKFVLSETSWEARVDKFLEVAKDILPFSKEYGKRIMHAFLNRIKLALDLDLEAFPKLKSTKVTLLRSSEYTVYDIEEDYGLNSISENVGITFIEGNHATILDNPHLIDALTKN